MNTSPKEIVPRSDHGTFVISHRFEASIERVYQMWIDPLQFASWLGPADARMKFFKTDVREGGTSLWMMTTPDGQTKHGQIDFKVIDVPRILVYRQNFCDQCGNFIKAPFSSTYPDYLLTTVRFAMEKSNVTLVDVQWQIYGLANESEYQTFANMKPVMATGWGDSFNKLALLLALEK